MATIGFQQLSTTFRALSNSLKQEAQRDGEALARAWLKTNKRKTTGMGVKYLAMDLVSMMRSTRANRARGDIYMTYYALCMLELYVEDPWYTQQLARARSL